MISPAIRAAVAAGLASGAAAKVEARSARLQTRQQMALAAQQAALAPKTATTKTAKTKVPSVKAPRGSLGAPGAEVSPYLDSDALLAMGQRSQDEEQKKADMGVDYAKQAADAVRGTQEAELDRVSGAEKIKNNAAARGLEGSSIRDGSLDTNDAEAARKVSDLQSGLAIKATQNDETRRRDLSGDADFMSALYARAAENAAAIPRDPRSAAVAAPRPPAAAKAKPAGAAAPPKNTASGGFTSPARAAQQAVAQRRAGNVKGSATLRRV